MAWLPIIEAFSSYFESKNHAFRTNGLCMIAVSEFSDSTLLCLRPFRVCPEANGRFRLVRRGSTNCILMKEVGYRACCVLRRPSVLADVRCSLASHFGLSSGRSIDLTPLLKALSSADLIQSVNGTLIPEKHPPRPRAMLNYWYKWHFLGHMERVLYQVSPLRRSRAALYCMTHLSTRSTYRLKIKAASTNFARCVFPRQGSKAVREARMLAFRQGYVHHLTQNSIDFRRLMSMPPAHAEAWMAEHVTYEGLEHLESALKPGRGVILAGFHFSVTKFLPFLLMRKGFTVTQVAVADGAMEASAFADWVTRFTASNAGFGSYHILSDLGVQGFRHLAGLLTEGGIAAWLPDIYFDKTSATSQTNRAELKELTATRSKFLGLNMLNAPLQRSEFQTSLLGQDVLMNAWAGAFSATTGCAVVPAALCRRRNGFHFSLYPPLRAGHGSRKTAAAEVNDALFLRLESLVKANPEQWFGWHSLTFANDRATYPADAH